MTMPISSVMRCRFIDSSRPFWAAAFWPARRLSVEGEENQGLDGARERPSPALSRALVDDASPPDRVPHVWEGSDVYGRIALEGDEIGGTSDGHPPRARLCREGSGRGCGPRRQAIWE